LTLQPTSFVTNDGSTIGLTEVLSQTAKVSISNYAGSLLRLVPVTQELESGDVFVLALEAFNLHSLRSAEIDLSYDANLIQLDSARKGPTLLLDGYVVFELGANGASIFVNDPVASIVDGNGYSQMALLYFTAGFLSAAATAETNLSPVELLTTSGSIPVSSVATAGATVNIGAMPPAAMQLTPFPTEISSTEHFQVDVELISLIDLKQTEFYLNFNSTYVRCDSVSKGLTLDAYDGLSWSADFEQAVRIRVEDTGSTDGRIVDSYGNSHLVTVYFGTNVIDSPAEGIIHPVLDTFITLDGFIPTVGVQAPDAAVSIAAFADREITFPDPGLESLIRYWTGNSSDPIMLSQVILLEWLDGNYYGIASLNGIHELVNLRYLDLNFNNISNLDPLAQLPVLTELYLMENQIVDIVPLSSLTSLKRLDLSNQPGYPGNAIVDVSPLESLANIHYLNLDGNSIVDIVPLAIGSVLAPGDTLSLNYNPLDATSCVFVGMLQADGVVVYENVCAQ
jgi:hypothetical protein